jgi:hypothetical protein
MGRNENEKRKFMFVPAKSRRKKMRKKKRGNVRPPRSGEDEKQRL